MRIKRTRYTSTQNNKIHLVIYIFWFVLISLFNSSSLSGQYHINFKGESAENIIQAVEKKLDVTFNFNHLYLPNNEYTFSYSGSRNEVLEALFSILDRNFIQLDSTIFAIQQDILPVEQKVEPTYISGTVLDNYGIELIAATVWMPRLGKAFTTNTEGKFEIQGYFAEEEKIEFSYLGYRSLKKTIGQIKQANNPRIILQAQEHVLGEIVVTAPSYIPTTHKIVIDEDAIVLDQIMPIAGRPDKDVLSAVQMLPGLYTTDESATEIQMRGGPPDQTNFDWNGIQLFQTSHYFGRISAINPYAVDLIAITKNGASVDRSGQVSGTVSMRDHNSTSDSLWTKLHSNLLYSNVGVNIPIVSDRIQLRLAWRKSFSEFFKNAVHDRYFDNSFQFGKLRNEYELQEQFDIDSIITLEPRLSYQDFFGSLKMKLSDRDFLKISGLVIDNQFDFIKTATDTDEAPRDNLNIRNTGYSIDYSHVWSDYNITKVNSSTSQYRYNNDYLLETNTSIRQEDVEENKLDQSALEVSHLYKRKMYNLSAGIKYERWNYDRSFVSTDGNIKNVIIDDQYSSNEKSAYLKGQWHGSRLWKIEAGLRYSDYNLGDRTYWEPRCHISYFPWKDWTIHGHWGRYHQVLNKEHVVTTFQVADRFWYLSNESGNGLFLEVVENQQESMGVSYAKGPWEFKSDFYLKQSRNIFSSAFDFLGQGSPFQFADLDIKGLEFSAKYSGEWLTLFWTYDRVKETLLYRDGTTTPTPFTQPHRFSLFQGFHWNRWQMSWHWKIASGRYFSDPNGIEMNTDNNGQSSSYVTFSNVLTNQLPIYHSLDVSLFYHFGNTIGKYKGKVGCSVSNLYNRENIIKRNFFIDYSQSELSIISQSWSGLPLTPNLVIEVMF